MSNYSVRHLKFLPNIDRTQCKLKKLSQKNNWYFKNLIIILYNKTLNKTMSIIIFITIFKFTIKLIIIKFVNLYNLLILPKSLYKSLIMNFIILSKKIKNNKK